MEHRLNSKALALSLESVMGDFRGEGRVEAETYKGGGTMSLP